MGAINTFMDEKKEEILEVLNKAGSEDYVTTWDDKGVPSSKSKKEVEKGKKSRKSGVDFEARVRADLEKQGWIVAKWPNNVDLSMKKIIPAKRKFNPFSKVMTLGTGFPDFICFKPNESGGYNIWGLECKVNGYLDREEKEKCAFFIDNKIFNEVVIAKRKKEGRLIEIEYIFFKEKYLKEKDI